MKNLSRTIFFSAFSLVASTLLGANIPAVDVTVSDASGKVAFKGKTAANGTFATRKLEPGNYIVQFSSKTPLQGDGFAIVVSAGQKKVSASALSGAKFAKGGVAMKVSVGANLNIAGQVALSGDAAHQGMVWIPPQLGSNMPGRWVPEGSPEAIEAKHTHRMGKQDVERMTEKSFNPQG